MPNILASPRYWKKKAVLFKSETTYGTDSTPGSANYFEARNVSLKSFDPETVDRGLALPYMGNSGKTIASNWSKLSFDIALAASGTAGNAPKWGAMMLALAFSETTAPGTSVTYNLVSELIGSGTAYLNIDGTLYKFIGCRGTVSASLSAKGIPMLKVELTSIYSAPVAASMPAVDKTGWTIEEAVNSINTGKVTIAGVDLAFSSLDWSLSNDVKRIDLAGPQREVVIADRSPSCGVTVLAPALTVFDPYALASASTAITLSNTHGTVVGKKIKTDIKGVITAVDEVEVNGMLGYKLGIEPRPVAGNDEITLTLS